MAVKLQILICTYGKRLTEIDIDGMPFMPDVHYLVCCQNPDGLNLSDAARRLTERGDTDVLFFEDKGLSINRNHSLRTATAPYVMLGDDDVSWREEGLRRIIDTFDSDPTLDIVTIRSELLEKRVYPPDGHDLSKRARFYSAISFEISLRRESIKRIGLQFSPLAGIGAPYLKCGEEELFLYHALNGGLKGRFIDVVAVHHRGETTSVRQCAEPAIIRAKGALMRILRGNAKAIIRLPIEAWRAPIGFFRALWYLIQGFCYSVKHRKEL